MRNNAILNSYFSSFRMASFRYFVFSPGIISSFRYFAWRFFVFSPGVISSFRPARTPSEKTKKRHAKRRNNEKTPREKTKRRHAKRRNNATRNNAMRNNEKTPGEKTPKRNLTLNAFANNVSLVSRLLHY